MESYGEEAEAPGLREILHPERLRGNRDERIECGGSGQDILLRS